MLFSIFMMSIADLRFLFVIWRVFAVGERSVLIPSTREANSYFEEEMASTFVEEKAVDIHPCQWLVWLVSITLHSTRNTSSKSFYHVQLPAATRFKFGVQLQNNRMALVKVIRTLEASSRTMRDARPLEDFSTRVYIRFNSLSCTCERAFVYCHCELLTPRLLVCFHAWVCSFCNFYLF